MPHIESTVMPSFAQPQEPVQPMGTFAQPPQGPVQPMGTFAQPPRGPVQPMGTFAQPPQGPVPVAPQGIPAYPTQQGIPAYPTQQGIPAYPAGPQGIPFYPTQQGAEARLALGFGLKPNRGGGRRSTRTRPVSCLRIISSISPNSGTASSTFQVTVTGDLFSAGDAVQIVHATLGSSLAISNIVVVNTNKITADVTVDESSQFGSYNVFVGPSESPQCVGALLGGFTVNAP